MNDLPHNYKIYIRYIAYIDSETWWLTDKDGQLIGTGILYQTESSHQNTEAIAAALNAATQKREQLSDVIGRLDYLLKSQGT